MNMRSITARKAAEAFAGPGAKVTYVEWLGEPDRTVCDPHDHFMVLVETDADVKPDMMLFVTVGLSKTRVHRVRESVEFTNTAL